MSARSRLVDIPPVPPVLGSGGPTLSLTDVEATQRLHDVGPNELPRARGPHVGRRIVRNLLNYFAILLWIAAVLAFFARLPELGIAIIVVILLNAVFAFLQEGRADRAAEALRALVPRRAKVFRGNCLVERDVRDLVPDDIVLLEAGDRIPVDGTVLESTECSIDASMLTGESRPIHVSVGEAVFSGTFAVSGSAVLIATHTGKHTRIAELSRLATSSHRPPTPLEIELQRVVRIIAAIAIGIGVLFLAVTLLLGNPPSEAFVFGVGVMVALVPEALLPTVTLTLALGAQRMARSNVLIRDLEAVETLGSVTYICTDKTGTLTKNQMNVVQTWTPNGDELALIRAALLASTANQDTPGEPMEIALDRHANTLHTSHSLEHTRTPVRKLFPFDSTRRRMSAALDGVVVTKGAPDAVFAACPPAPAAEDVVLRWAQRGLRVLAVAQRPITALPIDADSAERELELLGLIAFEDPPRDGVVEAIAQCRASGINIAMLTGDHPETARAIADEIGLRDLNDPVLIGDELPVDDESLGAILDQPGIVISRITPEGKLRVANTLRARGHVVAMTGDGVNDAPALHVANVGVAMGQAGTDVARESADIVLLDNHFASIVSGIALGRSTYVNIRRFLTYHLTGNVAELTPFVVWAVSGGSIPLALGVLQILAIDIGTDTWAATALGAERGTQRIDQTHPVRGHIMGRDVLIRAFGVLGPVTALCSMCAFFATFAVVGWRPGDVFPMGTVLLAASGATYLTVVCAQAANGFACRSTSRWAGALGWTTNPYLIPATIASLAFAIGLVMIPPIASIFGQTTPLAIGWLIAVITPFVLIAVDSATKRVRISFVQPHNAPP